LNIYILRRDMMIWRRKKNNADRMRSLNLLPMMMKMMKFKVINCKKSSKKKIARVRLNKRFQVCFLYNSDET